MNNELEFNSDHWMARSYRRFVELGGRERSPENLCRFLRVVFFWAPLRRFFKGNAPIDCTPFGFVALVSTVSAIVIGLGLGAHHILFNDWTLGLIAAWVVWGGVSIAAFCVWFFDEGGQEDVADWLHDKIVIPYQSIQTYRKARASRFCPLITFRAEGK